LNASLLCLVCKGCLGLTAAEIISVETCLSRKHNWIPILFLIVGLSLTQSLRESYFWSLQDPPLMYIGRNQVEN